MSTLAQSINLGIELPAAPDVDEELAEGALHPLVPSAGVTYYYDINPQTKEHAHYETGM